METNIARLDTVIQADYGNIAGLVVLKNGERIHERYFDGFTPEDTVHVMSVTKSIVSALVGIALDKGAMQSVDQKVLDFFPDYPVRRGEKTIQNVTIKNLLTMTAPYTYKSEPYAKVYASDDWTKAALDVLGGRSGITGEFRYSTVGTQILSGIIARATGQSVIDFTAEHLFEPLGIQAPPATAVRNKKEYMAFLKAGHASGWMADPKGVNTAGWGLCLTPRDMAKIGLVYLAGGVYRGRRIVSPAWIEDSVKEQSRWGELRYGYLWWIIEGRGRQCYAALGDGGNAIFVDPEKNLVVAIAARFKPGAKPITELIAEHIVPSFE